MKNFKLCFAIILVNVTGITKLYSSADDRNFREAERAYYGKIDQAYEELCKLNPSQEKIEEFKQRNNPIINAALIKYQIEKLLASEFKSVIKYQIEKLLASEFKSVSSASSVRSHQKDSEGWYTENKFESDK